MSNPADAGDSSRSICTKDLRRIGAHLRRHALFKTRETIRLPDRGEHIPQSFAQQRIWFIEKALPGTSRYHMPECARLSGELDRTIMRQALRKIVERHEAWRTTFATEGGLPVQKIAAMIEPGVTEEMVDKETEDAETVARARLAAYAEIPFDLERGPLVRMHLLSLGPLDHFLLLNVHHIVSDGWSTGIFMREFAEIYSSLKRAWTPLLGDLAVQYRDYALWQREYWRGDRYEALLSYWQEQLAGLSQISFPPDHERSCSTSDAGDFKMIALSRSVTDQLKRLALQHNTTLFVVLESAFKAVLHRLTGLHDIAIGVPVAGRSRVEFEPLLGLFANTVVLRSNFSSNPTFTELLASETRTALEGYAYQDAPFEGIVERLQPDRDEGKNPFFQIMFILQNTPMRAMDLPGLSLELVATGTRSVKFDIVFELYETDQGLCGWMGYLSNLFAEQTIQRLLSRYEMFLTDIVHDPKRRVSMIKIASHAEARDALAMFNEPLIK